MLHVGVCCTVASVPCSFEVTCWKRADLLAVMLVFVVLLRLFLAALRSPAGKGLTSWLSCLLSLSISHICPSPHQNKGRGLHRETGLSPPLNIFTYCSKALLLLWTIYVFCLVFVMPLCSSVCLCLVVTCLGRADLLAPVCGV